MSNELEDMYIHNILAELLAGSNRFEHLLIMRSLHGVGGDQIGIVLDRLNSLALIKSAPQDIRTIQLTPHGMDVARHEGGYLGYKQAENTRRQQEQQAQAERNALDQAAAEATVSSAVSAKSAARAAWAAVVFSLVSIAISIIALLKPDGTEELKKQLTTVQQQVARLEAQAAVFGEVKKSQTAPPVDRPRSTRPAAPSHSHQR